MDVDSSMFCGSVDCQSTSTTSCSEDFNAGSVDVSYLSHLRRPQIPPIGVSQTTCPPPSLPPPSSAGFVRRTPPSYGPSNGVVGYLGDVNDDTITRCRSNTWHGGRARLGNPVGRQLQPPIFSTTNIGSGPVSEDGCSVVDGFNFDDDDNEDTRSRLSTQSNSIDSTCDLSDPNVGVPFSTTTHLGNGSPSTASTSGIAAAEPHGSAACTPPSLPSPSGIPTTTTTASGRKATSRRNAWGNLSYADLITRAIESSPEKRLTLSQIYAWMVANVPFFRDKGENNSSAGWKVSNIVCVFLIVKNLTPLLST